MTAFSDEYDLNDPELATPLGIAVSAGLGLISAGGGDLVAGVQLGIQVGHPAVYGDSAREIPSQHLTGWPWRATTTR